MDWQLVIDRNRAALLTIIVALIAKLGLSDGGVLTTLPHFLYHRALRILRAAESALRRLIVIAAHELTLRGLKSSKPRVTFTNFMLLNSLPAHHIPAFNLIDPRKIFGLETSDFDEFGHSNCDEEGNSHGDDGQQDRTPIAAASFGRRLLALKNALDTIPKQALRLARWYSQRDLARNQNLLHLYSPMRPGTPPGSRRRKRDEIDEILLECHVMAIYALDRRDTS